MTGQTHHAPIARRHLRRSREDRVLGGVCGGIARYSGRSTRWLRVGAVVLTLLSGGTAILVYLAAWVLLPQGDGEQAHAPGPVVDDVGARDAWTAAGGELRSLAAGLRKAPTAALPDADADAERLERSRTAAVDRVMTALGDRLRDPDVRDGARRAAAGVSTAVAASVDELGRRGRRSRTEASGTSATGTTPTGPES